MPLQAVVEISQIPDGHEAGASAASQAVERLARQPLVMAYILASHTYDLNQVKSGVSSVLGAQAPLIGCSASGVLFGQSRYSRAVTVAILGGRHLNVQADWLPDPGDDPQILASLLEQSAGASGADGGGLFVMGDGFNGVADLFCRLPLDPSLAVAGGLAGGSLQSGRTFQIGGRNSGSGGLAVAWLPEQIRMSAAAACGWAAIGNPVQIDRVEGLWVREIDGHPPSELLASLFGFPARQWAFPPLNESIRQYPLSLQMEDGELVRSALRVEADGSLRMNAAIPEGYPARIMVGSLPNCLQAASQAAQQALDGLQGARPVFGLLLVDTAWQGLLEAHPGAEAAAVQQVLGMSLPVLGGYGFGQIVRPAPGKDLQLLNQHLELVLFGTY